MNLRHLQRRPVIPSSSRATPRDLPRDLFLSPYMVDRRRGARHGVGLGAASELQTLAPVGAVPVWRAGGAGGKGPFACEIPRLRLVPAGRGRRVGRRGPARVGHGLRLGMTGGGLLLEWRRQVALASKLAGSSRRRRARRVAPQAGHTVRRTLLLRLAVPVIQACRGRPPAGEYTTGPVGHCDEPPGLSPGGLRSTLVFAETEPVIVQ